ncbi:MAG: DUF1573 domain-containing protein [Bacteroidetes bacterium]|jgi:hypothetical protein|nr:DUF1573 domain-containing protein [Bacteroidota bacterium]MBK9635837.1 DUF1573 domain-containing protein [Bacteroidota bacterium]
MKRLFLIGVSFLMVFANADAQEISTKAPTMNPKMKFAESEFVFPKGIVGKPVTHEFFFINKGTEPLKIESATASCGCTTPKWTTETVLPGKMGSVVVTYNMGHAGKFSKTVTVITTAGEKVILYIKGEAVDGLNQGGDKPIDFDNNKKPIKIKKTILETKEKKP